MFGAPISAANTMMTETDCNGTDDEGFGLGLLNHHLRSLAQNESPYKFLSKAPSSKRGLACGEKQYFIHLDRESGIRDALESPTFNRVDRRKSESRLSGPSQEDLHTPRFIIAKGSSSHASMRPSEIEVSMSAEERDLQRPRLSSEQI